MTKAREELRYSGDALVLAKSGGGSRGPVTLAAHTEAVLEAFHALFGDANRPTALASSWLRFFRLAPEQMPRFMAHGALTAFCHDWGKANDGFQQMLRRPKARSQLVRHEHLAAVLLMEEPVQQWLRHPNLDLPLVVAAVVGHHLKARDVDFGRALGEPTGILKLLWQSPEWSEYLGRAANSLGLPPEVPRDLPQLWTLDGTAGTADLDAALESTREALEDLDEELQEDPTRTRLLWAVRSALIASDAAGSGLPREGHDIGHWIVDALHTPRCDSDTADGRMTGETVREAVLTPRLSQIGLAPTDLNPFQEACSDPLRVPARALLLAPCGSGKTLAAWQWIAARCDEHSRRAAVFLYPTRGTATEGYRDYAAHAGTREAALVHGTSDLDLDDIHPDVSDEKRIQEARLFALRQWPRRILSATVDQFLGFLQHGYQATCLLPVLADSVVVFDEIHSYDRGMFSALLEFLRQFDLPALCMTATLLDRRRADLERAGLTVVNGLDPGGSSAGLAELRSAADHARYRVSKATDEREAEAAVHRALAEGYRVLWVVNTVDRCQAIARRLAIDPDADELRTRQDAKLFCYHSRYRLGDRRRWHEAVVSAFRREDAAARAPVLAVTTQVCEMSLDLDADLLVTETCPPTALVQRMGRCCRDSTAHRTGRTADVLVYDPPGDSPRQAALPYTERELAASVPFVAELTGATVSQTRLEELLEAISAPGDLPKECRFTTSGPWATGGEEQFRDTSDFSRPALLADDLAEYARLRDFRRRGDDPPWRASALEMTIPCRHAQPHGRHDIPKWLWLAKDGTYHPALGFCCGEVRTGALIL